MPDDHTASHLASEEVQGEASAVSAGQMMMTSSHATGLLFENAVSNQQLASQLAIANISKEINRIFGGDIESQLRGGRGISNAIAIAKMMAHSRS